MKFPDLKQMGMVSCDDPGGFRHMLPEHLVGNVIIFAGFVPLELVSCVVMCMHVYD